MTPDAKILVNRLEMIINMPLVSIYSYERERVRMQKEEWKTSETAASF